jgi:hypothetical protein
MDQARGDKKMDPKAVETYRNLSRVVVSVCHGGPISVIEPKKEEEKEGEAEGNAENAENTAVTKADLPK